MRTIAILAAVIVGWFFAALALSIFETVSGVVIGAVGALFPLVAAAGLAVLIARLIPRSARTQARQDERLERAIRRNLKHG